MSDPDELHLHLTNHVRRLIAAGFAGRDELYAAAEALQDDGHRIVCDRLAAVLAGDATQLQQTLVRLGEEISDPTPDSLESWDEAVFEEAKRRQDETGVLNAAAAGMHRLRGCYEQALESPANVSLYRLLRMHCNDVVLSEQILRQMAD